MDTLELRWRRSGMTSAACDGLARVLAAHPGTTPVVVVANTGERLALGVCVDSTDRELRPAIRDATDPAVTILDRRADIEPW